MHGSLRLYTRARPLANLAALKEPQRLHHGNLTTGTLEDPEHNSVFQKDFCPSQKDSCASLPLDDPDTNATVQVCCSVLAVRFKLSIVSKLP